MARNGAKWHEKLKTDTHNFEALQIRFNPSYPMKMLNTLISATFFICNASIVHASTEELPAHEWNNPADTIKKTDNPEVVPGCAAPAGFFVAYTTQHTVTVQWQAGNPSTAGFELAGIKKSDQSPEALDHPVFVSAGNTYTFLGLTHSTEYFFYIRRVCLTPIQGSYDYSDWIRIGGRTTASVPSDCGSDTTLISIANVTHESFDFVLSPWRYLHANARRLLVRYRLTQVPPTSMAPASLGVWQERLIYNANDLRIDHLFSGGTYEVYCTQLRNGSYMDYTKACPEVGPFVVTLASYNDQCKYATAVTASCTGADFVTLHFDGPALGYDSLRYLIAIKPQQGGADTWKFYYHFNGAVTTIGDLEENTTYEIYAYLMIGKSGYNYDYLCTEIPIETVATHPRADVDDIDGDGIPDLCDPDDTDGPTGDSNQNGIQNQYDTVTPQDPYPDMPDTECGLPTQIHPYDPQQLLDAAAIGEIFFINDFPILLTQVSGGNGDFSGEGIIGLPFQTKYLKVEFSNVKVSDTHVIFAGVVNGVAEDLNGLPHLPLDTIMFGESRFCMPKSEEEGFGENGMWSSTNSEYNPLGFNQNGQYQMPPYQGWQPGDPYDPNYDQNGFDADGIHFETGTLFNPEGCSQTGFTEDGQVCDPGTNGPYYWLEPGTTTEGVAFANEVKDTLRPIVLAQLEELTQSTLDSITVIKIRCDLQRDSMRMYFDNLEYSTEKDRLFIFGPNDDWFREGMSRKFKEEPKKLGIELDRDPNEALLEEMHINLYHCDVNLMRYEAILGIIDQLQQEPQITGIVDHLHDLISRFNQEQVDFYSNIINLEEWIHGKLDSIVTAEYDGSHPTGSLHDRLDPRWTILETYPSITAKRSTAMGMLASQCTHTNFDFQLMQVASQIIWEDVAFEYHQGRKTIGGIDRAFFLEAIKNSRKSTVLTSNDSASLLPITISKDVMGRTYTLYLDSLVFTPGGGSANVYIIINTNPSPDRLVFKAMKIPFGPSGFTGNPRLYLGTNISITLSNAVKMNLLGNNNTYIDFDCEGFKGINLDGEIEFCREYVVPLKPGSLIPKPDPERVKAHFVVGMPSWGEFVVSLSIEPFAITKYDSIKWQATQIVFDFSSSLTPPTIMFPPNYSSPFVQSQNGIITASGLWKGFYINNLTVTLPKQFGKNAGDLITIGANHIIFDDTGLTGEVFAAPILSLCEGNLGGWAFSIDTFALIFAKNRLTGSTINGLLNLPIFSKGNGTCAIIDDCVRYEAAIMPGNFYSFSVKPVSEYVVDLWKATAIIEPSSEVEIKFQNGEFYAKAVLNGSISINADFGSNFIVQIPDIRFQNLVLRNKPPYFDPGIWDVSNSSLGVGFGGFGLLIDTVRMIRVPSDDAKANLKFRAGIIIVDLDIGVFIAKGGFQLKGQLTTFNNRQRWVYDGLIVDDVCLDISFPGVDNAVGCLAFFGQDEPHQVFGRGFKGKVLVNFQGIDAEITALGVFGNTGTNKYFMIDALSKFNPGIGIGVMQLIGFGGGAAYHMNVVGDLDTGLPEDIPNTDPATLALGLSLSNLVYSPNPDNGLSIHATVVLALAKEEAFNLNASFGISFYTNGGIEKVYFKGTARFMDKLKFSGPPQYEEGGVPDIDAQICAYAYISYGFATKELHGTFKVNIDAAGVLKGTGETELVIKPGYWFINIGTPAKEVKLAFVIPGLNIKLGMISFYLDIGKNIPAFPGLPSNVKTLTGLGNIVANESLRRSGHGFATGVKLDATTGNLKFLIFYAHFDLGLGFDMMVQDYGNAVCINNNNEQLGINGWYASGQMWAYVKGDVGVFVRLWGKDREFSILKISLAAAMQAKFPNPFYGRGAVGGNYRILGGLIKGNCRFEFKIGQECQIAGGIDPNQDQKIIVEVSPLDSIENVFTMTIPRVNFSIPMNEDLNDGTDTWRAQVIQANILKDGIILSDQETLLDGKLILEVKPVNVLPSNTWITFRIKVQVFKNGIHFKYEEEEVTFKTGDTPDIIPMENVSAAYPMNGQYNFYRNEHPYNKGHIILKFGMPELFQTTPPGYSRLMRLTKMGVGSSISEFAFTYNSVQQKIEFSLPGNLQFNKVYCLEMINKPSSSVNTPTSTTDDGNNNSDDPSVPFSMYKVYFRVSQYDKFADKIEAIKQNIQFTSYKDWIKGYYHINEPLDFFELHGGETEPLVNTFLDLTSNSWFAQQKPKLKLVYNYFLGYNYDPAKCGIDLFTNTTNYFDQQNFSMMPIGFEEEVGGNSLRLSSTGGTPSLPDTISQYIDFTTINEFYEMWDHFRDKLITYKTWKCSGVTEWSAYSLACNLPCCTTGQGGACCNDTCVFGGENTVFSYMLYNPMPLPGNGTKFPVMVQYIIPGHGLTTSKTIDLIKP